MSDEYDPGPDDPHDWEDRIQFRAFQREQESNVAARAVNHAKDARDGGRKRR